MIFGTGGDTLNYWYNDARFGKYCCKELTVIIIIIILVLIKE